MTDPERWSDASGHAFMCATRSGERPCDCGGGEWIAKRKPTVRTVPTIHKNLPRLEAVAPDGRVIAWSWLDQSWHEDGEVA